MKIRRCAFSLGLVLAIGAASLSAQAQEVYWSLGWSAPGVQIGASNALPVFVQPRYQPIYQPGYAPVVEYASPYWREPTVRMAPPSVVYLPRPAVYAAPLQYTGVQWRGQNQARNWRWAERREHYRHSRDHHRDRDD